MICDMPFLVSIGEPSGSNYSLGSLVISKIYQSALIEISCKQSPNDELVNLVSRNKIIQLFGDVATMHESGVSWIEALGAWKQPVILMVESSSNGEITGIASAYTSLCRTFSVPLLGLVQLGGYWNPKLRRLDCLPWCGFIPNEFLDSNFAWDKSNEKYSIFIEDLETILLRRMAFLKL